MYIHLIAQAGLFGTIGNIGEVESLDWKQIPQGSSSEQHRLEQGLCCQTQPSSLARPRSPQRQLTSRVVLPAAAQDGNSERPAQPAPRKNFTWVGGDGVTSRVCDVSAWAGPAVCLIKRDAEPPNASRSYRGERSRQRRRRRRRSERAC